MISKIGEVIQIQAQGTCDSLGKFCISPMESNAECYNLHGMQLQEKNYIRIGCSHNFQLLCLQTAVKAAMNNTHYTVLCSRQQCGILSSWVGTTSKLIVAGK